MLRLVFLFFFFNDTATTEIYTLSLHDALPILDHDVYVWDAGIVRPLYLRRPGRRRYNGRTIRSEEHTSELQSLRHLVCRLLLEKKKQPTNHAQVSFCISTTHIQKLQLTCEGVD